MLLCAAEPGLVSGMDDGPSAQGERSVDRESAAGIELIYLHGEDTQLASGHDLLFAWQQRTCLLIPDVFAAKWIELTFGAKPLIHDAHVGRFGQGLEELLCPARLSHRVGEFGHMQEVANLLN